MTNLLIKVESADLKINLGFLTRPGFWLIDGMP